MTRGPRMIGKVAAVAATGAIAGWSAYAGLAWLRYGKPGQRVSKSNPLLDRFLPAPEVAERHQVEVAAPAPLTYAAACDMDLNRSAVVRLVFGAREMLLGGTRRNTNGTSLLTQTLELGWGVLAEERGREIVVGAVTQPWRGDVQFRALPPEQFAAFDEPGYAKIVWTLAADPLGPDASLFRTETRVATTDPDSRRRFRLYWSVFSPGILVIRRCGLGLVKAEAERRCREQFAAGSPPVAGPVDDGAAELRPMEAV
jgi:hypothetical protein